MPYCRNRWLVLWGVPCLFFLGGCGATTDCDSVETRNAVLQTISDDHNNALVNYAAKNSTVSQTEKPTNLESIKPEYLLGEKIVTTSTSKDKRTVTCSSAISVTVGDTKASKEVNFTVQRSSDGKLSVSVMPFKF
ncbi:hypothetical protein [Bradyrhizobium sp.]|uniref:hypothetical protein n=1 Tax=Bradyrhizobium sp. TaxID=376 RepID=UPI001DE5E98D|nr:hypothetical protein [Bradyrhizobium sp.]MBV8697274.1 hypothetical protein [Bradyrhizobium sp.]MBV8922554.1 hypothetical protein [Bradyrhizobium sp.]MBV9981581.1 hypothetical protein [Bradyrhizobium sp.]